jgi:hypothetical protein
MADKPYFVTEDSPLRLRKLLIRNPFIPTLYDNIRTGRAINDSIPVLDDQDALSDFILQQLHNYGLLSKVEESFETNYSRIVPPSKWPVDESYDYAQSLLTLSKESIIKNRDYKKMVRFGHYTGSLSPEDYSSMIEKLVAVIESYNDKPDGSIKYQTTFVSKQL